MPTGKHKPGIRPAVVLFCIQVTSEDDQKELVGEKME